MTGDLLRSQHGLEAADQVGGADNGLAQFPQHLHGSRIHQRYVHDGVARRVLHGQPGVWLKHGAQAGFQLLPRRIDVPAAGQGRQLAPLHPVGQLARFAFGWNEVIPAPRHVQRLAQTENAIGNRVAVMMVVKEPAIHLLLAKRLWICSRFISPDNLCYSRAALQAYGY